MIGPLTVTTRRSDLRCAVCHGDLGTAAAAECPACASWAHVECQQLVERCATLGCAHSMRSGSRLGRGFWARHFGPSSCRVVCDVFFGIFIPIVCLVVDPFVFTSESHALAGPLLPRALADACRALVFAEIALLAVWLDLRPRARFVRAIFGVAFFVGAFVALALGIVLFPMAVFGFLVGIGVLGFTPFFTAVAFLRNGVSAFSSPETPVSPRLAAQLK